MNLIEHYFPHLTSLQKRHFDLLDNLYRFWNEKINVISRKDIDQLTVHHVLHSLAIAKIIQFKSATKILDVGTGGGFPGIPLAILFPEAQFTLVDSIGKKIKVVEVIARELELDNVRTINNRVESIKETFDFITGRAVSNLPDFYSLVKRNIKQPGFNNLTNGILYLTGGELEHSTNKIPGSITIFNLNDFINEDFFITKKLVHIA
ncbi:MAG: 16S rRNA (guanine(527)-N(7))-methyltransferase RsmG [Bacteroidales bacterium]|nr:16S rRNA (guanine(527)-N(7))-methyltransferase RsmG [Bacteroidales bacterium]